MSSVFNDSERLYRTTVSCCLVRRPRYSARLMHFGSRGPSEFFSQIRDRNALNEIVWEDAVQGLGMAMSTVASVENRELLFIGNVFYSDTSLRVVLLVFRGLYLLKIANINPQQEARFSLWKKLVLRESCQNGV